jgi:polysaccharide export outer membrane protein
MLKALVGKVVVLSILFALVISCVPKKELVYLQPKDFNQSPDNEVFNYERKKYRLQINDILDVQVRSTNAEANELFNGGDNNARNQQGQVAMQSGGDIYYMTGYSVNDAGDIELPVLGNIAVKGLTIDEVKLKLDSAVGSYFSEFYLKVQLGGIRFAALGEFQNPGKFVILQNQLTIFEAIANAGDMTNVASRDNVTLIRQYPDGTRIHKVNLLDQSIITSPFYFIQPNDIIYAEPLVQKTYGLGVNGAQTLTTVISVISTSLALYLAISSL